MTSSKRALTLLLALAGLAAARAQDASPSPSAPATIGTSAAARYAPELGLYQLALPAGTHTLVLPLAMPASRSALDVFGPEIFDVDCVESWDPSARAWTAYFPGRPAALAGKRELASHHVRVTLRQPLVLTMRGSVSADPTLLAPQDADGPAGVVWPKDVPFSLLKDKLADGGFVAGRDPLYYWDVDGGRWSSAAAASGATLVRATTAFSAGIAPQPAASPSASASAPPPPTPRPATAAVTPPPAATRPAATALVRKTTPHALALGGEGTGPLSTDPALTAFAGVVDSDGEEIDGLASYTPATRAPVEAPRGAGYVLKAFYKKENEPTEALAKLAVPASLSRLAHLPATVAVRVHYQDDVEGKLQAYELLGVRELALDETSGSFTLGSGSTKPLKLFIGADGCLYGKAKAPLTAYPGVSGGYWHAAGTKVALTGAPVTVYYNPALQEDTVTGPVLQVHVPISTSAFAFRRWGLAATSPLPAPSGTAPVTANVGDGLRTTIGWWVELDVAKVPTLSVQLAGSWRANTLPATLRTDDAGRSVTAIDATGVVQCKLSVPDGTSGNISFPAIGDGATPLVATLWPSGRFDVHKDGTESIQATADLASYVFSDQDSIAAGIAPLVQVQGDQLPTLVPKLALTLTILVSGADGANDGLFFLTGSAQGQVQLGELARDLYAKKSVIFSSATLTAVRDGVKNLFHPPQGTSWTGRLETLGLQTASLRGGVAGAFGLGGGTPVAVYATGEKGIVRRSDSKSPLVGYTKVLAGLSVSSATGDPGSSFALQLAWQRKPSQDGKTLDETTTVELDGEYQLPSADPAGAKTDLDGQITASVKTATPVAAGKPVITRSFTFNFEEDQTRPSVKAGDAGLSKLVAGENFQAFTLDDFLLSFGSVDDGSGKIKRTGSWLVEMTARWKNPDAQADETGEGKDEKKEGEGAGTSAIDLMWTLEWDSVKSTPPATPTTAGPTFLGKLRSYFSTDLFSLPSAEDAELFIEADFQNVPSSTPGFKFDSASFALSSVEKHSKTTQAEIERSYAASLGMKVKPHADGEPFDISLNFERSAEGVSGGAYVEDAEVAKDCTLKEAFVTYATPEEKDAKFYRGLTIGGVFKYDDTDRKWLHPAVLGVEVSLAEKSVSVNGSLGSTCAPGAEWCFKNLSVNGSGKVSKEDGLAINVGVAGTAKLDFVDDARLAVTASLATKSKPHLKSLGADLSASVITMWDGWRLSNFDLAGQRDRVTDSFSGAGKATVVPPDNLNLGGFIALKPISASFSKNAGQLLVQGDFGGTTITIPGVGWKIGLQNVAFRRASPWALSSMKASFSAGGTTTYAVDVTPSTTGSSYRFAADPKVTVNVPLPDGYTFNIQKFSLTIAMVNGKLRITLAGHAKILGPAGQDLGEGDLSLEVGLDGSLTGTLANLVSGSGQGIGGGSSGIGHGALDSVTISSTVSDGKRTTTIGGSVSFTFGDDWPGLAGKTVTGKVQGSTSGDFSMLVTSTVQVDLPLVPVDLAISTFSITRSSGNFAVAGTANVTITEPISFGLGAHRGSSGDPSFHCGISVGQQTVSGQKKWVLAIEADTRSLATPSVNLGPMGTWSLAINKLLVSSLPDVELDVKLTKSTGFYVTVAGAYKPPAQFRLAINPSSPIQVGSSSDVYEFSLKNLFVGETFPDVLGIGTTICLRVGDSPAFKILINADDTFYALPSSIPPFGFPFFGDAVLQTGLTLEIAVLGFGGNITLALPRPAIPQGFDVAGLITNLVKGFEGDQPPYDDWQSQWSGLEQFLEKQVASILTIFRGPGMGNINLALPRVLKPVFPSLSLGYLSTTAACEGGTRRPGDQVVLFPVWSGMHYLSDLIPALFPDAASDAASIFVHLMHYIAILKQVFTAPATVFELIPEGKRSGSIDFSFAGSLAIHGGYAITNDKPLINTGDCQALPGFVQFVRFAQGANDPSVSGLDTLATIAAQKAPLSKQKAFAFQWPAATGQRYAGTADDQWVNPHDYALQAFAMMPTFVPDGEVFSPEIVLQRHIKLMTERHRGLTVSDADRPLPTADGRADLKLIGSTGRLQVTSDSGQIIYVGSAPLMGLTTITVPGMDGRLQLDSYLTVSGDKFTSNVRSSIVFPLTDDQLAQLAQHNACVAANQQYRRDLDAYQAYWSRYNTKVRNAHAQWAAQPTNIDWDSVEHAMNRDHSFKCEFTHYSPGDNWPQLCSTMGQVSGFVAAMQSHGGSDCHCYQYTAEEILSQLSDSYPFQRPPPDGTPPAPPYQPTCVDPGAPVQRAPIPMAWTHSAPLFVTGADAIRKSAGPSVTGWIATYKLDAGTPAAVNLTFTDWGTAKFEGPGCRFTMVFPGALLNDFHKAVHAISYFKDAIFSYDSSPYVLGLSVWTQLFPGKQNTTSSTVPFTASSVLAEGRTVRVALQGSDVAMSLTLNDIGYHLTPPAGGGASQGTESLDVATDLQSFAVKDGHTLVAKPFVVTVAGSGGADADQKPVQDLVIFEGGDAMAEVMQTWRQQKQALEPTDLGAFAKMGLTVDGQPVVVRDLVVGVDAGQVGSMVRPQRVDFLRRSDGITLATLNAGQGKLLATLESSGPYGDPLLYPAKPGQWVAYALDQSTSQWSSTVTSTTTDTLKAMGIQRIMRTFTIREPRAVAATFVQVSPGMFAASFPSGGTTVNLGTPQGYSLVSPHGTQAMLPMTTPIKQTLVDRRDVPIKPQPDTPTTLTLNLGPDGKTASGSVDFNGALRQIAFTKVDADTRFTYPTGDTLTGGLAASLTLELGVPSVMDFKARLEGLILNDGYFHFEGDVDLTLAGFDVADGRFMLDSETGLTILGKLDFEIAMAYFDGNVNRGTGVHAVGHLAAGLPAPTENARQRDFTIDRRTFTGVDSTMALDSQASPYLKLEGDALVYGGRLLSTVFEITNKSISFSLQESAGPVSADLGFTMSWGGSDFSVAISADCGLDVWLGTVHAHFSGELDIGAHPSLCIGIGPGYARIGFNPFSLGGGLGSCR